MAARTHLRLAALFLGLCGSSVGVMGASAASDSASDPTYTANGYFYSGQNAGTGFNPWYIVYHNNDFAGSFDNNPDAIGAPAWDIYAGDSSQTLAYRSFSGGSLSIGQTFTVTNESLRNLDGGGNGGFELADTNGDALLRVYAIGNTANYFIDDADGTGQIWSQSGNPTHAVGNAGYNYQSGDSFALTLLDSTGDYALTVTGNSSASYTGAFDLTTGGATQVAFFSENGGGNSDVDVEGISLNTAPVPEPASIALVAVGFGLLRRRVRR